MKNINMKNFADFWRGMFYFVATIGTVILLFLVIVRWQPIWTSGFKDVDKISDAIFRLDRTAKPVAEMAPLILTEMDEMRKAMLAMQASVKTVETLNPTMEAMNYSMNRMSWIIETRMNVMTGEVNQMGNKFSPMGMMPFNW